MDEMETGFVNLATQNATDNIDNYFDLIVKRASIELRKLPEVLFKEHFLPYFLGDGPVDKNAETIKKWLLVAGSLSSRVEIIDEQGNPIFTVPSLKNSESLDVLNKNGGQKFNSIMSNYLLHSNQLPIIGEKYLGSHLSDRFETLTKDTTIDSKNEDDILWLNIFKRYNKVGSSPSDKTTGISAGEKTKLDDDELLYD